MGDNYMAGSLVIRDSEYNYFVKRDWGDSVNRNTLIDSYFVDDETKATKMTEAEIKEAVKYLNKIRPNIYYCERVS